MSKIIKNVIITILVFCAIVPLVVFNTINVSASSLNVEVSELFIDYMDDAFANRDKVKVFDKDNNEITKEFFNETIELYTNKNYHEIKNIISCNVEEMYIDESYEIIETKSPFVTQVTSQRYYKEFSKAQANGELVYYLTGSFVWDRANGKITSISKAAIKDIKVSSLGSRWSYSINNVSTNSYISDGGYKANFEGSFNLRCVFKTAGITIYNINVGSFGGKKSYYPQG